MSLFASNHTPGRRPALRNFLWLGGAGLLAVILISCGTFSRSLVLPPSIPGATFVGSAQCAECHEDITRFFGTATHARLMAGGTNAIEAGCESCHGPGSLHVQSGGGPHTIISAGDFPKTCFGCHLDKHGEFQLPYRHPVLEGRLSCTDCHEPHRGSARNAGGRGFIDQGDQCSKCHLPQRGPFVFEHEALREGCNTCHAVHGSVNNKLLVARNANLCLKCHFQRQTAPGVIVIGGRDHTAFLGRGTCWSAGCHEAVHGSQVSSSLRF